MDVADYLWIREYKPTKLSEFIGFVKFQLLTYESKPNTLRNILIHSPHQGIGKSLLARLIAKQFFKDGEVHLFNALDYDDEERLLYMLKTISSSMRLKNDDTDKTITILDNFDIVSKETQMKIAVLAEKYVDNNLFILVADNITTIISKLKNDCMKVELRDVSVEEVKEHIDLILQTEEIEIEGFDITKFITERMPNIKCIYLDLQEMLTTQKVPNNNTYIHSSDLYLQIYDLLINTKDWVEVDHLMSQHNESINYRLLNNFIWDKAIEHNNIRIIQICESNEVEISNGADERRIFKTSLIELVK